MFVLAGLRLLPGACRVVAFQAKRGFVCREVCFSRSSARAALSLRPLGWAPRRRRRRHGSSNCPRLDRPATYAGPPLTLSDAIDEALQKNPTLIALRREFEAARQRPAQSQFLSPPTFSAQIWQWPINTLNPLNTNMYMLPIEQEIPGRGKRDLRTAVAQKDADLAANDVTVSARQLLSELKHAYATLLVARNAADVYGESRRGASTTGGRGRVEVRVGPNLAIRRPEAGRRVVEAVRRRADVSAASGSGLRPIERADGTSRGGADRRRWRTRRLMPSCRRSAPSSSSRPIISQTCRQPA